jgi:DNA (cytosine-5)-methyltransferase 1
LKEVLDLPYEEIESIQHVYEKVAVDNGYKFSFIKPGENYGTFRSSNRRLKIEGFSYTITKGGRYIHPVYHRLLSVREEARIQSFPEDFIFTGSKDNMYAQIGNAVPVMMAKVIGEVILNMEKKLNEVKTE